MLLHVSVTITEITENIIFAREVHKVQDKLYTRS